MGKDFGISVKASCEEMFVGDPYGNKTSTTSGAVYIIDSSNDLEYILNNKI